MATAGGMVNAGQRALRFRRPESVLVVVHTPDGRVLLLRRRAPGGYWQSVTGALHWGETPPEAACRELHEETGLGCVGLEPCGPSAWFEIYPQFLDRYAPGVTHNLEHVFRLELPEPVPVRTAPAEHDAWQWMEREAALRRVGSRTNRAAILRCVPDSRP